MENEKAIDTMNTEERKNLIEGTADEILEENIEAFLELAK